MYDLIIFRGAGKNPLYDLKNFRNNIFYFNYDHQKKYLALFQEQYDLFLKELNNDNIDYTVFLIKMLIIFIKNVNLYYYDLLN